MKIERIGLMVIKPPYAKNKNAKKDIINFVNQKILEEFKEPPKMIFNNLIEDGYNLAKQFYNHLEGEWEGLEEMLMYFKGNPVDVILFEGCSGINNFLKNITGKTRYETDENTIRGMMRKKYGTPEKEYMNFVHVSDPQSIKTELDLLNKMNICNFL